MFSQSTSSDPDSLPSCRILIVEDDPFVGEALHTMVLELGCKVTGTPINYASAVEFLNLGDTDLVLLDIRLAGMRSGLDIAAFIQQMERPVPYIYLTDTVNPEVLDAVQQSEPLGHLYKPIRLKPMLTSLKVTINNFRQSLPKSTPTVLLTDGKQSQAYTVADLVYLQAEHVYTRVTSDRFEPLLVRQSLTLTLDQFADPVLLRVHRSYAVQCDKVTGYDATTVYVGEYRIPISRRRRTEVHEQLANRLAVG